MKESLSAHDLSPIRESKANILIVDAAVSQLRKELQEAHGDGVKELLEKAEISRTQNERLIENTPQEIANEVSKIKNNLKLEWGKVTGNEEPDELGLICIEVYMAAIMKKVDKPFEEGNSKLLEHISQEYIKLKSEI